MFQQRLKIIEWLKWEIFCQKQIILESTDLNELPASENDTNDILQTFR